MISLQVGDCCMWSLISCEEGVPPSVDKVTKGSQGGLMAAFLDSLRMDLGAMPPKPKITLKLDIDFS